jgi:hypothetical protein
MARRADPRVLLAVCLVLALPFPAAAQQGVPPPPPPPAPRAPAPRLEYTFVEGCPNEATFRAKLALIFRAQDPFDPNAPDAVRVTCT